jgi:hypothetical protein
MAATAEVIDYKNVGSAPLADYQPHTVDLVVRAFESHLPELALKQTARVIQDTDCTVTTEAILGERERYGYYLVHVTTTSTHLEEAVSEASEAFLDVVGRYEDLGFVTLDSAKVDEESTQSMELNVAEIFMRARDRKLRQLYEERCARNRELQQLFKQQAAEETTELHYAITA